MKTNSYVRVYFIKPKWICKTFHMLFNKRLLLEKRQAKFPK
ncbi:hypothetical protein WZ211_1200 [Enterococcus faecalis]|nr:hypothetical protein WZ211_1200 [Enterococcus faecalis]OSH46097.1 hypothetical protein YM392_1218 [Enterococcus faecalis]